MTGRKGKILIVDDEWETSIMGAVRRRMEDEGWDSIVVEPEGQGLLAEEFESVALYALEVQRPDGVLLDVRFGEHPDDRFKGLGILRKIVERPPRLPILMFTQYAQGPEREMAVRGSLKWDAPIDFVDKLAGPEEVVLRLRRLIGTAPDVIPIGPSIRLDTESRTVYVGSGDRSKPVHEIRGVKFEILRELATTWYRSPGQLVAFTKLERLSEGQDPRRVLRVRIREIKDALGGAMGLHFGAQDLIVNIRDEGYRLVPPKS